MSDEQLLSLHGPGEIARCVLLCVALASWYIYTSTTHIYDIIEWVVQ